MKARVIPMSVGPTAVSGVIGTDTAIGGGDFQIPVWAKGLINMSLGVAQDTPVAAEAVIARSNVISNNCNIQPMQGIAAPIGSAIAAAVDGQFIGKVEEYPVDLTVNGGEQITPNIRTVTTGTAVYGFMSFLISELPPSAPHKHVQCGTATTGAVTNNNEVNGTQYSLSGAQDVIELIGTAAQVTVTTAEGYLGRLRYQSAEFAGVNTADLLLNPYGGVIAAGALMSQHIDGVSRQRCNIPVQNVSQCNIQDSFRFLSSANLGAAPTFLSGLIYETYK